VKPMKRACLIALVAWVVTGFAVYAGPASRSADASSGHSAQNASVVRGGSSTSSSGSSQQSSTRGNGQSGSAPVVFVTIAPYGLDWGCWGWPVVYGQFTGPQARVQPHRVPVANGAGGIIGVGGEPISATHIGVGGEGNVGVIGVGGEGNTYVNRKDGR